MVLFLLHKDQEICIGSNRFPYENRKFDYKIQVSCPGDSTLFSMFQKHYCNDDSVGFEKDAREYVEQNKDCARVVMDKVLEASNRNAAEYERFLRDVAAHATGPSVIYLRPVLMFNSWQVQGNEAVIDVAPLFYDKFDDAMRKETKTVLSELLHAWQFSTRGQRIPDADNIAVSNHRESLYSELCWGENISSFILEIMPGVYHDIAKQGLIDINPDFFEKYPEGSLYDWLSPLRTRLVAYAVKTKKYDLTSLEKHAIETVNEWREDIKRYWEEKGL